MTGKFDIPNEEITKDERYLNNFMLFVLDQLSTISKTQKEILQRLPEKTQPLSKEPKILREFWRCFDYLDELTTIEGDLRHPIEDHISTFNHAPNPATQIWLSFPHLVQGGNGEIFTQPNINKVKRLIHNTKTHQFIKSGKARSTINYRTMHLWQFNRIQKGVPQ